MTEKPGLTNLVEHRIPVTTATPVRSRPYTIPYSCRERLKKEIDDMVEMGIAERADTPYTSPVVIVKKKDSSNRICIDYRKLNKVSVFDGEPSPVAMDIFAKIVASIIKPLLAQLSQ